MPVEFARVSQKRKHGLVLVIHVELPEPSPTSYLMSARNNLEQAVKDLAERERTDIDHIGYAARSGASFSRNPGIADSVGEWLMASHLDAVVWTDLDGNFDEHTGQEFSHEAGLTHLRELTGVSLYEAWRYITYAPSETDTPFRRFLAIDDWWSALTHDVVRVDT